MSEEGGFTTTAAALALLVSLALVLSLVQVQWLSARSADVQAVADSTAIAGCQVVRAYSLVAQVLDAITVTLGIAGVFVMGAGLVTSLIPGANLVGVHITEVGTSIFQTRSSFAHSAAEGLQKIENALPYLIMLDSLVTAQANGREDGIRYVGVALPSPWESGSQFRTGDDVDPEAMAEANAKAAEVAAKRKEAMDKVSAAKERAWRADCGGSTTMRSRAADLASLSESQNPYASLDGWDFSMALSRARAYYSARLAIETPQGESANERANSEMRKAWYRYAIDELSRAVAIDTDELVSITLPSLAHTTDETRVTSLYTDVLWPCSDEPAGRTIHGFPECPGATGPASGTATLAQQDEGEVLVCPQCHLSITQMGQVAAASTNTTSGFEHYWREVVEASRAYVPARSELDQAERESEEAQRNGVDAFKEALRAFETPRPKLQPPGCYGCVAVAYRGELAKGALSQALSPGARLAPGLAVSGATLAPEAETYGTTIFNHLFDGISQGEGGFFESVLGFVGDMWASLLVAYGNASETLSGVLDDFFSTMDDFGLGFIADPVKDALADAVETLGLQPADLRMKKPVICSVSDILTKDGNDIYGKVQAIIGELPADGDAGSLIRTYVQNHGVEALDREIDLGTIKFLGIEIPIKINLADLLGLKGEAGI